MGISIECVPFPENFVIFVLKLYVLMHFKVHDALSSTKSIIDLTYLGNSFPQAFASLALSRYVCLSVTP